MSLSCVERRRTGTLEKKKKSMQKSAAGRGGKKKDFPIVFLIHTLTRSCQLWSFMYRRASGNGKPNLKLR